MITKNSKTDLDTSLDNSSTNASPYDSVPRVPDNPFRKVKILGIGVLLIVLAIESVSFMFRVLNKQNWGENAAQKSQQSKPLKKFASEDEFKKYLEDSASLSENYGSFGRSDLMALDLPTTGSSNFGSIGLSPAGSAFETTQKSSRFSQTNVQVAGIDEPDILKTDGKNIYYSGQNFVYPFRESLSRLESLDPKMVPDSYTPPTTKIIEAFPPSNLKELSKITETGDFLLYKDNLTIFSNEKVVSYNVSDRTSPKKGWTLELKDNNSVITSRLMGNNIYLVTGTGISQYNPCTIPVFSSGLRDISIVCTDIYKPNYVISADTTYTIFKLDPVTGEVKDKTSFIGNSSQNVVYMSPSALYITYTKTGSFTDVFLDFYIEETGDLFPSQMIEKFKKIKSYDISAEAKMLELEKIGEQYRSSRSDDEQARIQNEFQNKMEDYMKRRSRDLVQTAIAKIDINTLKINSSTLVPGTPLNQFSLDEYEGFLRIATTIGGGTIGRELSANDVYVFDTQMNLFGSVKDLGLTERIYSVRFIADKGYIVTFRQIDPFYVLDLSDPKNPVLKGELKIPGYSGYLHPINKNSIIGVGMESGNVKLSLFNVENSENPLEVSKYNLDEYHSEAVTNHHAFLMDPENEIFFMPGGNGGYIFSFSGNQLSLKRVVTDVSAKRAVYINDYLYIAGDDKLVVINLDGYEEVNRLSF